MLLQCPASKAITDLPNFMWSYLYQNLFALAFSFFKKCIISIWNLNSWSLWMWIWILKQKENIVHVDAPPETISTTSALTVGFFVRFYDFFKLGISIWKGSVQIFRLLKNLKWCFHIFYLQEWCHEMKRSTTETSEKSFFLLQWFKVTVILLPGW